MTRTTAVILAASMWVAIMREPQTAPLRDTDLRPTTGTGTISGVVMTAENQPSPVRRAIVTLTGPDLRPSRGAITDDDGRFRIATLPAGRFTLTATRASFVTSVYGAKRPGRPGTAIALAEGVTVTNLVVRIWRAVAIAGVVRDESGAPVPGVPVTATPARAIVGQTILTLSNNGAKTNNLGEFRLFGLEPGTYVVSVKPSAGGGGPLTSMGDAEVDAALEALAHRAPGSVAAAGTKMPPLPRPFAYAPIYFPGTADIGQATPISLAAGQERTDLDISLQRIPTATVSGAVTRLDGMPADGATMQLRSVAKRGPFVADTLVLDSTADGNGRFRIPQVAPGDYRLIARALAQPSPPSAPNAGSIVRTLGPTNPSLWAIADISVSGGDVGDLRLRVEPGLTISGRTRFEGTTLVPPSDLAQVRVFLQSPAILALRPGQPVNSISFLPPVQARADGTFQVAGLMPDLYSFNVTAPAATAAGWWVRSAMAGDRDLLDGMNDFTRDVPSGTVIVTFSDRHTELSGTLQTRAGAPASDVFVIAYAADRKYWNAGSRRVRAVRPDVDGRYSIKDLPQGDYLLGAVTDIDQDEWFAPGFLDALEGSSTKVSIAEGGNTVQNLRLGGGILRADR